LFVTLTPEGPAAAAISMGRKASILSVMYLASVCFGCSNRPPDADDSTYVSTIAAARQEKDTSFLDRRDSPVPKARRAEMLPLAYFPINPSYRVPAVLTPSDDQTVITMPTSAGGQRQMKRAGTLQFTLRDQQLRLTAFVEGPGDRLFVPFTDLTSGAETYPGGRYLDLDRNVTGIYMVDFNRAYHPDCYYGDPTADCPFPPLENRLKIPIHAGERIKETS
jgi:uncharacterized protein (DUF1684 family)